MGSTFSGPGGLDEGRVDFRPREPELEDAEDPGTFVEQAPPPRLAGEPETEQEHKSSPGSEPSPEDPARQDDPAEGRPDVP